MLRPLKHRKTSNSESAQFKQLRLASWSIHAPVHAKNMPCPACGFNTLERDHKGSWEGGHINARVYHERSSAAGPLTKFDLIPICHACNKMMGTKCFWDWLYERNRTQILKQLAFNIYMVYRQEFPTEMEHLHDMCWKLIVYRLHGRERFTQGGGISHANETAIIGILKLHQQKLLEQDMKDLLDQLEQKRRLVQRLLENR